MLPGKEWPLGAESKRIETESKKEKRIAGKNHRGTPSHGTRCRSITRRVTLGRPFDGVRLMLPAGGAALVMLPVKPRALTAKTTESGSAAAQRHNLLGRQLTSTGRYREAVLESTEALRIAPDFALALNARGYAWVLLRDWARAIDDLDHAIRVNPSYGNAYRIRAVAKNHG